ncbi:single-stranded DNA-binding protein (plasmid) [Borreliella afzelii]|uniref:Single-stranded DNA-binding protein n=1 Tax=Borreliella afzelii TaxID=29518 RepID=A0A1L4DGM9_BORAF|nr:single-stranded DNA-binding protein [Borreliella afzelii]
MNNVSEKNQNIQNNIQAKIKFRKDMQTLRMNLPGIDKSLINKGYGYKYQNFNDIVEEIYNVIKKHNLELDFEQNPISKEGQYGIFDYIRTTFYSTSAEYEQSFDTRIHIDASKNNSIPQQVGSAITYFKRYALVGHLNIKSEVDTDAALNYNDYENRNSTPNKQVNVKQEQKKEQKKEIDQIQKKDIKQEQKKDRLYYYSIFKEALSNIKNWVNSPTEKDNIVSIIQKIRFIQNIDPNNVDDIKKIEADLIAYFEKNSDFKSINYWAEIIKDYFKKNNRLKDLQDFEKFMSFKRTAYGPSPLLFFSVLKEEKQFDYIFAA